VLTRWVGVQLGLLLVYELSAGMGVLEVEVTSTGSISRTRYGVLSATGLNKWHSDAEIQSQIPERKISALV
jgi:hypothetical protein